MTLLATAPIQVPMPHNHAYLNKVAQMLADLPHDGAIFDMDKNVRTANRVQFIEAVKEYMALKPGAAAGWELSFNSDYTRIRKNATAASLQVYHEQAMLERKLRAGLC